MNFIEELSWRGMIHQMTSGAADVLSKGDVYGYCGFDPSASSLQIGNLAAIMMMVHFQRTGNKPFALVGGATGIIGDPSGKSAERNLLSPEEVEYNLMQFKKQLTKFLDFSEGKYKAEIVNNYDWFSSIGFLDFLRNIGKHLTVGYMISKDSVKNRLESGISYTEFSYQFLQAYDFYYLHKTKRVSVQFGGSDQWGNITSGTELIRRIDGAEAYAVTQPLVLRADGQKFGKSADGQKLWLDSKMTSPYQFYQFWLNVEDSMCERYLKVFTFLTADEISGITAEHNNAPHLRAMQKTLAKEVTTLVHSKKEYETAANASEILFGNAGEEALRALSPETFLSIFEGVPQKKIPISDILNKNIVDVAVFADTLFSSKSEVRRNISAISVNKKRIVNEEFTFNENELLHEKYILLQKGKKNYFVLETVR
ncbi:MAG: tyrosine--tRNA ligase [Chitinispirillales bacterium]|jgi:tyrosyl-tRNA synthetase|nr:tyrosine--tRNA ligase [Chitinispirillales bacterium]